MALFHVIIIALYASETKVLLSNLTKLFDSILLEILYFISQGIFISKISEGGPAGNEGILSVGDKIIKVGLSFLLSYFLFSNSYTSKIFS